MITLETEVVRNPNIAFRKVEKKGLIMDPNTSMLHNINETAMAIWEFLDSKKKVSNIVDMLIREFSCDQEHAKRDVIFFLKGLYSAGLVTIERI